MNLIKNKHDYEFLKDSLKAMKWQQDHSSKSGAIYWSLNSDIQVIEQTLLQYRREQGIFEVGDSVIPISNYSDQVHFLSEWYIENLDFRYTTKNGLWGVIVKSCMGTAWRHATPEEIAAGHRL